MSYYQKHVFFCINQRDSSRECCFNAGATELCLYTKKRIKALNLNGKHHIRVSSAGCLGRCSEGPVIVIYPEQIWYTYKNQADIDEIITKHLLEGQIVERLLLPK